LRIRVQGLELRVQGLGLRVRSSDPTFLNRAAAALSPDKYGRRGTSVRLLLGLGFGVWGLGFGVWG